MTELEKAVSKWKALTNDERHDVFKTLEANWQALRPNAYPAVIRLLNATFAAKKKK